MENVALCLHTASRSLTQRGILRKVSVSNLCPSSSRRKNGAGRIPVNYSMLRNSGTIWDRAWPPNVRRHRRNIRLLDRKGHRGHERREGHGHDRRGHGGSDRRRRLPSAPGGR